MPFLVLGFWPVAGFFGLDLLALYVAFRINYRAGRSFEQVELTPLGSCCARSAIGASAREWRFNPLWTPLDREVDDEFGLQRLCARLPRRAGRHRPRPLAAGARDLRGGVRHGAVRVKRGA